MGLTADFAARFRNFWAGAGSPPGPWIIAVSGGPDSVALLRLAAELVPPATLVAAHFDHAIRPQSRRDATFVGQLAAALGVPYADERQASADVRPGEAAARRQRYRFLRTVAEQFGARYLVVGHTADDQVETILHRIVRGTGLRGLAGMQPFRSMGPALTIARPLLTYRRAELLDYLHELHQPYLRDPTNDDCVYTRNRIRHDLLPRLAAEYNLKIGDAILRLGQSAAAAQWEIERLAEQRLAQSNPQITLGYACIPVDGWRGASPFLVREMLALAWREAGWPEQGMGHGHWQRLASMALDPRPARAVFPAEVVVTRRSTWLILHGPSARPSDADSPAST